MAWVEKELKARYEYCKGCKFLAKWLYIYAYSMNAYTGTNKEK